MVADVYRGEDRPKPPKHPPRPPVVAILPLDAREALVAASRVQPIRDRADAVDRAMDEARRKYPQFFK